MMKKRPGSSALEINLRRTATKVEIPRYQQVLLDATRASVGVHDKTRALLEEVNHPFVNWAHVLGELRSYGSGNFYYHNAFERGDEAIRVVIRIFFAAADYFSVFESAESPLLRQEAVRALLRYLEKVIADSETKRERNRPVIEEAVAGLLGRFEVEPNLAAALSGAVRRVVRIARDEDPELDPALLARLAALSLSETYRAWLDLPDPAEWVGPAGPTRLPSLYRIGHESMGRYRALLDEIPDDECDRLVDEADDLPDQTMIEGLYLHAAAEVEKHYTGWEGYTREVLFLLRILDTKSLRQIRDPALRAINRALSRALRLEERPDADRFIDAVFDSFQSGWLQHDTTVLDCIHTIALDVLRSGDDRLTQKVVDRILDHGFETPELRGVNELWQFEVNPAHIKNIRSWVELIAADPHRMKRLLVGLIFHLKLGGVFVRDTDLFQKDMANLLNGKIRPVFNLVKQLGRLFPIYYSEIGAEGKLRTVSTRIDEVGRRHDSVIHFLRKQCHVESSYQLIPFCEAILRYWATGNHDEMKPCLPAEIHARVAGEEEDLAAMRPIFTKMAEEREGYPESLLRLGDEETEKLALSFDGGTEPVREKALLMIRLYRLLDRKYRIGPDGVLDALAASPLVEGESVQALREVLETGRHTDALETVVDVLESLKKVILDEKVAESREDIYHKRHIAAGIPSMYGRFLNRKLEALGLTYRLESFATVLFERMLEQENLHYLTKRGIGRISRWLVLFQRALWVDGVKGRGLGARIDMLESAARLESITIDQYINIFQFTSRTLREIIRGVIIAPYEIDSDRIVPSYPPEEGTDLPDREWQHMRLEAFLRDQMSSCFALQTLDNLLSRILSTLTYEAETFNKTTRNLLMSYDVDKTYVPLRGGGAAPHDPILLGHKGSFLKRMTGFGYPVPAGFIVTTEVYRTLATLIAFRDLRKHSLTKLTSHVRLVEAQTGRVFGDPRNPLLLSVRSGSAISMPGILDTFLNVGINEKIAEGLSQCPRFGWAAWDSYRRFLQLWGLSYGVPQETFDRIFEEYKQRFSVAKKAFFTVDQIREIALACRAAILDHGVELEEDPFKQLRFCIERVIHSWDADRAKHYRKEMKIADDWGTAVVVQAMVYGNLDDRSGTGVVFTRNPRVQSGGVRLYGDFVLRSQGEDVVRGVVETYPISEEQRSMSSHQSECSLQSAFPEIYEEIRRIAVDLVPQRGFNHQEIEFTFEDRDVSSLYILQARDIITPEQRMVITFVATPELEKSYLTCGIGAGGGALSGRVAHNEKEIDEVWKNHPDCKIILVRPNTVPEDMHMIFSSDGLLTSRGGATSHAAVTAQRIGRTCVVGCMALQVDERSGRTRIGDRVIRSGDFLSINGFDGSVYLGQHEVKQIRRLTDI